MIRSVVSDTNHAFDWLGRVYYPVSRVLVMWDAPVMVTGLAVCGFSVHLGWCKCSAQFGGPPNGSLPTGIHVALALLTSDNTKLFWRKKWQFKLSCILQSLLTHLRIMLSFNLHCVCKIPTMYMKNRICLKQISQPLKATSQLCRTSSAQVCWWLLHWMNKSKVPASFLDMRWSFLKWVNRKGYENDIF